MARDDIQMNIRIPATLRAMLERAAEASGQSVAAELVYRLEASFPENVTHLLIKRREEELQMVEAQLEHKNWMWSQLETIDDAAGLERVRAEVSHLKHQALSLTNDIDRLRRSLPVSEGGRGEKPSAPEKTPR